MICIESIFCTFKHYYFDLIYCQLGNFCDCFIFVLICDKTMMWKKKYCKNLISKEENIGDVAILYTCNTTQSYLNHLICFEQIDLHAAD